MVCLLGEPVGWFGVSLRVERAEDRNVVDYLWLISQLALNQIKCINIYYPFLRLLLHIIIYFSYCLHYGNGKMDIYLV